MLDKEKDRGQGIHPRGKLIDGFAGVNIDVAELFPFFFTPC